MSASANERGEAFKEMSRNTLSAYETGASTPAIDVAIALAEALETTPEWIYFGLGNPNVTNNAFGRSNWSAGLWSSTRSPSLGHASARAPIILAAQTQTFGIDDLAILLVVEEGAEPDEQPAEFIILDDGGPVFVQMMKAGDKILFSEDGEYWRLRRPEDPPLLGRLIDELKWHPPRLS